MNIFWQPIIHAQQNIFEKNSHKSSWSTSLRFFWHLLRPNQMLEYPQSLVSKENVVDFKMNSRLSKFCSLHRYVMHRMFYFERYLTVECYETEITMPYISGCQCFKQLNSDNLWNEHGKIGSNQSFPKSISKWRTDQSNSMLGRKAYTKILKWRN